MNVFYTCSAHNIEKYQKYYLLTRSLVLEAGHTLTRDWIPAAIERRQSGAAEVPRSQLYGEVLESVKRADVCIFDNSVHGMISGYLISYALESSKPTLVLARSDDDVSFGNQFLAGSKSGFLTLKGYKSAKDIEVIVRRFLKKHSEVGKIRFNLVLDRYQAEFVEKLAQKNKVTKTEIVKGAIENEIIKHPELQSALEIPRSTDLNESV